MTPRKMRNVLLFTFTTIQNQIIPVKYSRGSPDRDAVPASETNPDPRSSLCIVWPTPWHLSCCHACQMLFLASSSPIYSCAPWPHRRLISHQGSFLLYPIFLSFSNLRYLPQIFTNHFSYSNFYPFILLLYYEINKYYMNAEN